MENLQQVLNLQQTYTTALCGHINVIFLRITKLEADIQKLTEKFMMEQDAVQIDAPNFDPDTNGPDTQQAHHTIAVVSVHELLTSPDPESIGTSLTQDISIQRFQTIHLKIIPQHTNRLPQQNTTFLTKSHN